MSKPMLSTVAAMQNMALVMSQYCEEYDKPMADWLIKYSHTRTECKPEATDYVYISDALGLAMQKVVQHNPTLVGPLLAKMLDGLDPEDSLLFICVISRAHQKAAILSATPYVEKNPENLYALAAVLLYLAKDNKFQGDNLEAIARMAGRTVEHQINKQEQDHLTMLQKVKESLDNLGFSSIDGYCKSTDFQKKVSTILFGETWSTLHCNEGMSVGNIIENVLIKKPPFASSAPQYGVVGP